MKHWPNMLCVSVNLGVTSNLGSSTRKYLIEIHNSMKWQNIYLLSKMTEEDHDRTNN